MLRPTRDPHRGRIPTRVVRLRRTVAEGSRGPAGGRIARLGDPTRSSSSGKAVLSARTSESTGKRSELWGFGRSLRLREAFRELCRRALGHVLLRPRHRRSGLTGWPPPGRTGSLGGGGSQGDPSARIGACRTVQRHEGQGTPTPAGGHVPESSFAGSYCAAKTPPGTQFLALWQSATHWFGYVLL